MAGLTDAFGHAIQAGDKVIYNLSGELALGIVITARITKEYKVNYAPYIRYEYLIEIQYIKSDNSYNAPNKGISRVRNPKSIAVLEGIQHDN